MTELKHNKKYDTILIIGFCLLSIGILYHIHLFYYYNDWSIKSQYELTDVEILSKYRFEEFNYFNGLWISFNIYGTVIILWYCEILPKITLRGIIRFLKHKIKTYKDVYK